MNPDLAPADHEIRIERQRLGWSLLGLTVMAAPQVTHIPLWMTACAVMLGGWRLACAWRGWRLPGGKSLKALLLVVTALVLTTFRTLNGAEAAGALLLLLGMLKLMEAKGLRDYFLLMLVAYFLGIDDFLYDQTIPLALYMLPAILITTTALLNVAHPDPERSFSASLRSTARLLLPALPVAVVLFLLFPRISGPIWGIASQKRTGVTGLSTSMSPGDLSQLAQSDEVAFHVSFAGPPPPANKLYWRALVLHDYDGRTWSAGNLPWLYPLTLVSESRPLDYDVTLEPNNLTTLYTLDLPGKIPADTTLSAGYEVGVRSAVTERKLYHVTSYLDTSYGADMPRWMLARDLMLPKGRDPQARALARQWRASSTSPEQVVQDAIAMFHDQKFFYTLQPGQLQGEDRVDQFLFRSRRGFCEYYAGAFVFLMRAAGIPAHVVIGYQGGTLNPLDGYYVVRQREAHAWAEIWISGRGWIRVDPTAAVDPARVEQGLDASLAADEMEGSLFDRYPLLGSVRNGWDALNSGWNEWVLAYGPELQEKFYRKVGLDYGNWLQLAMVLGGLIVAALSLFLIYLAWERRPPPASPAAREYARFCARLAKVGLRRERHEGPLDYAARVGTQRADLKLEVMRITECYVELRYLDRGDLRRLARLVRGFRPARKAA